MLLLLLTYVVLRALWKIDVYLINTLVNKSLYHYYNYYLLVTLLLLIYVQWVKVRRTYLLFGDRQARTNTHVGYWVITIITRQPDTSLSLIHQLALNIDTLISSNEFLTISS